MNRREFFGRAAALPAAAVAGAIAIQARAPAQIQAPVPAAPIVPSSPAPAPRPRPPILEERTLSPFQAIRTVRELASWTRLFPAAFNIWDLPIYPDLFRAIEKLELFFEGSPFAPRHVRRLQLRTPRFTLVDAPGEIFKVRTPRGATPRLEINFGTLPPGVPMCIDATKVEQLQLSAELGDRCKPLRIRVFVTHWIGGPR